MNTANSTKSLLKFFYKFGSIRAVIAIALVLFSAESALAILRLGEIGESPEYNLSSTSDPKARCKTSSLTQEKFLEMLHAVIDHGNLTDKDFIEKTFQIKFGPAKEAFADSHIAGGGFFNADMPRDISDAPIHIALDIGTLKLNEKHKRELYSGILFDHLNRVGAVFHDCQYLTKNQLDPKSAAVIKSFDLDSNKAITRKFEEPSALATWNLEKPAKNGAKVKIRYSFRTDGSDAIENITISEHSEAEHKSIGESQ